VTSPTSHLSLQLPDGVIYRNADYTIKCLRNLDAVEAEGGRWNEIALQSPQRLPMLSHAWVTAHFSYLTAVPGSWCILFAYKGDQLVGALPLSLGTRKRFGQSLSSLATPFGDHILSVDFALASGYERETMEVLLEALAAALGKKLELRFRRLHSASPALAFAGIGIPKWLAVKNVDGTGSYLSISGTMDAYKNSLSSNFRKNLRKSAKKLAELSEVRFDFKRSDSTSASDLDSFLQLEASGWKGREKTAILGSPAVESFYHDLTLQLKQLGWLEWHLLSVAGKPIAAQMATRLERTLVVMKIAYDETFSHVSPGNLLFEKTVERAYEDGDTDEINCLTDMAWHRNWKMEQRPYYDLTMYPRTAGSLLSTIISSAASSIMRRSTMAVKVSRFLRAGRSGSNDD
jgi:CelD/BcsL family acetyltransferase involved in cellulose biosynthesis